MRFWLVYKKRDLDQFTKRDLRDVKSAILGVND